LIRWADGYPFAIFHLENLAIHKQLANKKQWRSYIECSILSGAAGIF
jgi:hypothetical protein